MNKTALVVFGNELPAGKRFPQGCEVIRADDYKMAGSIYEANAFVKELSFKRLADGTRITKSFLYQGYELWWMHYGSLFFHFCLPYTQYKRLLARLTDFDTVYFYRPSHANLFVRYLTAYGVESHVIRDGNFKNSSLLPFGVFLQILITLISLPALAAQRHRFMLYIGDKFDVGKDYDFRMKFIYEELRRRKRSFVEFIRSLESWKIVLRHAFVRRRPVVYSEAITFVGRFVSILSGGSRRIHQKFGADKLGGQNAEERFKISIATHYLLGVDAEVWAIRIMKNILRLIGVKVAHITSASERSFHTVLGCKLNAIPIVGIQHGITPRHYAVYEFMDGFDGEKTLSVDRYGLWSEGWREYFRTYSKAYKPEQLYVSGPMRPLEVTAPRVRGLSDGAKIRVLFISEQLAEPSEVLPYLNALIDAKEFTVRLKMRPYRDGFEKWLLRNRPDLLDKVEVVRGDIHQAALESDVVVGSHSTAVIEALAVPRPFVFFDTKKWGDYFDIRALHLEQTFFAENTQDLLTAVRASRRISRVVLQELQMHLLGDPHKNGSAWVVAQIEEVLAKENRLHPKRNKV